MKNYGEAFRYFRKLNGYSLEYAAADSISKSQLSRFERGENEISLSTFLNYYKYQCFDREFLLIT